MKKEDEMKLNRTEMSMIRRISRFAIERQKEKYRAQKNTRITVNRTGDLE